MRRKKKIVENQRHYKLSHQVLCITALNFQRQTLIGYTELTLTPNKSGLRWVRLNSQQTRVHIVKINDTFECPFSYSDPTLEMCQGEGRQRNLDFFSAAHLTAVTSVDGSCGNGELSIRIPTEAQHLIQDGKPFRISLEFSLESPKGGIHFVVPSGEGSFADRGAHAYSCGRFNSSRLWFPCMDTYCDPCTWRMEFTVDIPFTVVSCGDLVETVLTHDMKKRTFHYALNVPTCAPNIAFAVGNFEILVDPQMHEVTHFCLPHLLPLLKQCTSFLHEAFEFYEELLSSRYPYTCYKQVFVAEAYDDVSPYATMTILSTNLLHSKHIIDQAYESRRLMARAIAQQFFGAYISMHQWSDLWLPLGIAYYLAGQYNKKAFGNNEYRFFIQRDLQQVIQYEQEYGGIVLDPSVPPQPLPQAAGTAPNPNRDANFHFPQKHLHTFSPHFVEILARKSHLVIRMLENRIGRELLLQVFNKLLSLASFATQQKVASNTWDNMLLSTSSFQKAIFIVTGKEIDIFLEEWVRQGGHAKLHASFVFNRKRNTVELEIRQPDSTGMGIKKYMGPLIVNIQELDGTFKHTIQVEENATKHDITCHSKSRRNKKKKIPLSTGEEVDMDLSSMDADSPVLWIRIDPEMQLLRQVVLEQPDFQWQFQLRYERDVTAQMDAIVALRHFPSASTRMTLTDIIENDECYYRVRCQAAFCLRHVANQMVTSWAGPPAMMTIFKKMFGSHSCPNIIRQNNFSNFQHYFLQQAIPVAMAGLRNIHSKCPNEVLDFLIKLFKYNNNSKNRYSDNYYRKALIDALTETLTPVVSVLMQQTEGHEVQVRAENLSPETRLLLEEVTRCLNLEKLLPCYKFTVTCGCLKAIRRLQKMGHIPNSPVLFREYAAYGQFDDVRLAALEALVDYVMVDGTKEDLDFLLDIIETDPVPMIRFKLLRLLTMNPPFDRKSQSEYNTDDLVERLWRLMNSSLSHDNRLRCAIVDFYHVLYGRNRPNCLPMPELGMVLNLKERKTKLNAAALLKDMRHFEKIKAEVEEEEEDKDEGAGEETMAALKEESPALGYDDDQQQPEVEPEPEYEPEIKTEPYDHCLMGDDEPEMMTSHRDEDDDHAAVSRSEPVSREFKQEMMTSQDNDEDDDGGHDDDERLKIVTSRANSETEMMMMSRDDDASEMMTSRDDEETDMAVSRDDEEREQPDDDYGRHHSDDEAIKQEREPTPASEYTPMDVSGEHERDDEELEQEESREQAPDEPEPSRYAVQPSLPPENEGPPTKLRIKDLLNSYRGGEESQEGGLSMGGADSTEDSVSQSFTGHQEGGPVSFESEMFGRSGEEGSASKSHKHKKKKKKNKKHKEKHRSKHERPSSGSANPSPHTMSNVLPSPQHEGI